MKKRIVLILVVLSLVFLYNEVFADNTKRIEELKSEVQILQTRQVEYQRTLSNIQVRLIQIQAILGELDAQDKVEE